MADITKLVKVKPDEKKQVDVDAQLLAESDWELINSWDTGKQRRAMPTGIRKRYVQNK